MVNFPASLDSLANPTATTNRDDPGFALHTVISTLNDIAELLEAKLGIGATTPDAQFKSLVASAAGTSAWGYSAPVSLGTASSAGATATFSFSSIPQTFKHLLIVHSIRCVTTGASTPAQYTAYLLSKINGDNTAANYNSQVSYGKGSTGTVAEILGTIAFAVVGMIPNDDNSPASMFGAGTIWIPDYAAAKKHTIYGAGGVASDTTGRGGVIQAVGSHNSAAAITSLTLLQYAGGNLSNGSYAELIGIP